jgi:hypothetical protein
MRNRRTRLSYRQRVAAKGHDDQRGILSGEGGVPADDQPGGRHDDRLA